MKWWNYVILAVTFSVYKAFEMSFWLALILAVVSSLILTMVIESLRKDDDQST